MKRNLIIFATTLMMGTLALAAVPATASSTASQSIQGSGLATSATNQIAPLPDCWPCPKGSLTNVNAEIASNIAPLPDCWPCPKGKLTNDSSVAELQLVAPEFRIS